MSYYAHSANSLGEWQTQKQHLERTTAKMLEFASALGIEQEAHVAGILHDIGKYGDLFQERLYGRRKHIDHWTPGAWIALTQHRSIAAALAIQGHHTGLQCGCESSLRALDPHKLSQTRSDGLTISESDIQKLNERFLQDFPAIEYTGISSSISETISAMFDVRMLYSTLVDADFLDTEEHFNAGTDKSRPLSPQLNPEHAYKLLIDYMDGIRRKSKSSNEVSLLREDLLASCLEAADCTTGLWTLTAPTGSGKTLAMLAWALKHAIYNKLRRIVIVIPYLSIIEQTADIYRTIFDQEFGPNYVLEHHSLKEYSDDKQLENDSRLLAQNWDAPIIITTSVQMLESLFANKSTPCRKLHRLAKSIILFDEVQTVPSRLAVATTATLSYLSQRYNSSIVFATATQPAFEHLDTDIAKLNNGSHGWKPTEIVDSSLKLFDRARRVTVKWPEPNECLTWKQIAEQMVDSEQGLCIVNLKRQAHELMKALSDCGCQNVHHLSTAMCPAHRKDVLNTAKKELADKRTCRTVSTQCIEAGCDISFPNVWRAFADLSSIAQAAGRCNRNGEWGMREMSVFIPEDNDYPDTLYRQSADVTKTLISKLGSENMDINDPSVYQQYYITLYNIVSPQTAKKAKQIEEAIVMQDYVKLAQLYKLIEQDTINILVPYDMEVYKELDGDANRNGLSSKWIQRSRPYSISLFRPKNNHPVYDRLKPVMLGNEVSGDWFIYLDADDYTDKGLIPPDAPALWIA